MPIGAGATEKSASGAARSLVPVLGLGCSNRLEWQDQNGAQAKPPESVAEARRTVEAWIGANRP